MSEENNIDLFAEIKSDVASKARKKALQRINTARVILGIYALITAFISIWFAAFLVVLLVANYKWPFISLCIASVLFSISFLLMLPETCRKAVTWEGVNVATQLGELSACPLVLYLIYLIIRGAMAAKTHGEFKK